MFKKIAYTILLATSTLTTPLSSQAVITIDPSNDDGLVTRSTTREGLESVGVVVKLNSQGHVTALSSATLISPRHLLTCRHNWTSPKSDNDLFPEVSCGPTNDYEFGAVSLGGQYYRVIEAHDFLSDSDFANQFAEFQRKKGEVESTPAGVMTLDMLQTMLGIQTPLKKKADECLSFSKRWLELLRYSEFVVLKLDKDVNNVIPLPIGLIESGSQEITMAGYGQIPIIRDLKADGSNVPDVNINGEFVLKSNVENAEVQITQLPLTSQNGYNPTAANVYTTQCRTISGDSGGAVINSVNELVGISTGNFWHYPGNPELENLIQTLNSGEARSRYDFELATTIRDPRSARLQATAEAKRLYAKHLGDVFRAQLQYFAEGNKEHTYVAGISPDVKRWIEGIIHQEVEHETV